MAIAPSEAFGELEGDAPELVPPGEYRLRFLYHETKMIFDRPKVFLWFSILDFGDHFEKRVPRYYGAHHLIGTRGKGGRFKAGHKSDFKREFLTVCPMNVSRLDRLPITRLADVVIIGKVKTVTRGHKQRLIPLEAQYSVVEQLLRAENAPIPTAAPLPTAPPT